MSVRNVVKVMNFHALLRVNDARKKVEKAFAYERELKYVIATIVNNRIFNQENLSLDFSKNEKELNIYIGSDLGFCSSFNFDVMSYLKQDIPENDKIIIGKRVDCDVPNKVLYLDKEKFLDNENKIYDLVLEGILNKKYSKINIIYIHYHNAHLSIVKCFHPLSHLNDPLSLLIATESFQSKSVYKYLHTKRFLPLHFIKENK